MPSINKSKNNTLRKLLFFRRGSTTTASTSTIVCSTSSSDDEATISKHDSIKLPLPPMVKRTVSKKRLRRSVHFNEDTNIVVTNDTAALTDPERRDAFWSKEELCSIRKDIKETVGWLSRGTCCAASARGLEKWLSPFEYRDQRQELLQAVLTEQRIQKAEGQIDEEMLADASLDCSKSQIEAALARANDDHKFVVAMIQQHCSLVEDKIFGANAQQTSNRRLGRARPRRATQRMLAQQQQQPVAMEVATEAA